MKSTACNVTRVFSVLLSAALLSISALAAVPRFAYVANSKDATVSVYTVDATTGQLRNNGYALTGTKPSGVAVAGAFVYVSSAGKSNVSGFKADASTGGLTELTGSPFAAGKAPAAITSDPAGKFVFVANKGAASVSAFAINATTGALTVVAGSPFPAGTSPAALAVDPTGKFLYAGNNGSNSVSAFSIGASGALTAVAGSPFPAGTAPAAVSIAPSGKFVYVANSGSNNVSGYSIGASGALTPVPNSPFPADTKPAGIAVDPNSKFTYVANGKSNTVSAFTIAANGALTAIGSAVAAGKVPAAVTVDASAKFVFVANTTSDDISTFAIGGTGALTPVVPGPTRARLAPSALVLSSGSSAVVYAPAFAFGPIFSGVTAAMSVLSVNNTSGAMTVIPGGPFSTGSPQHLAVSPNGKFVYTANRDGSNTVGEFSINPGTGVPTSVGTIPTGNSPVGVVVDPSGRFVYSSGLNTNSIFAYKVNPQTGALTNVTGSPFTGVGSPSALAVDPTGRYLMAAEACCANTAGIFVYVINPKTGVLKAVAGSPFLPPANTAEPGSVTVDPTGRFVYVSNNGSFGNTGITAYSITAATGKLQLTGGLLPGSNTSPAIVATDVVGKYVYLTETVTTTSAFTIDNATGALTKMSGSPFTGTGLMQGVVADASGRFLYISNGNNVIGYSINPSTGFLTALPTSPYPAGATIFDLGLSWTIH